MAKNIMLTVREPDYMEEFHCIGSLCTDTCCKGWDIVIDEATCARYEKTKDKEFKAELAQAIVHREEEQADGTTEAVACIRMGKGQRCLFLRNDGLCRIQRQTEEKNLSETCRTYPRVIYSWNESYAERALCVSCPEAARLILGRNRPLRFVTRELPEAELEGLRITDEGERLRPECLTLRRFIVRILQDRQLSLADRLVLANDFFWQAGGLTGRHAQKQLQMMMEDYAQRLQAAGKRRILMSACAGRRRLPQFLPLLQLRLQNPELRADFRGMLERAVQHWQLQHGFSETGAARYEEDEEFYLTFFLPEYSGLLENYLVNAVFKNLFMTEERPDYYTEWFRLVLQFSMVRFLLIAQLAELQQMPERSQVIELIQKTTRAVGHDRLYLDQAAAQLAAGQEAETALREFCRTVFCTEKKSRTCR